MTAAGMIAPEFRAVVTGMEHLRFDPFLALRQAIAEPSPDLDVPFPDRSRIE
jgi:hypothetical protein